MPAFVTYVVFPCSDCLEIQRQKMSVLWNQSCRFSDSAWDAPATPGCLVPVLALISIPAPYEVQSEKQQASVQILVSLTFSAGAPDGIPAPGLVNLARGTQRGKAQARVQSWLRICGKSKTCL